MITAGQFKKGTVITFEGTQWIVEDYHIHKMAQRRPVRQTKLRHLKSGRVVDRTFDDNDQFEQPELQSKPHQFLYAEKAGYVFMDLETFEQLAIPEDLVGNSKWVLKEGAELVIRFIDGQPVQILFPPNFVDEVTDTAEPTAAGRSSNVMKDARLACGLTIKVPLFIRVGEHVKVNTETHEYLGKETVRK